MHVVYVVHLRAVAVSLGNEEDKTGRGQNQDQYTWLTKRAIAVSEGRRKTKQAEDRTRTSTHGYYRAVAVQEGRRKT